MQNQDLIQLIKKYSTKKNYKVWEYLFKKDEDNYNLYFIYSWKINLEQWWNNIFTVSSWQIIWEKSFIQKQIKPLDAVVAHDSIVYELKYEDFQNLSQKKQNQIITLLLVFVSNRVFDMNNILDLLALFNKKILEYSYSYKQELLQEILSQLMVLDSYLILKVQADGSYSQLMWDMMFDESIYDFIDSLIQENSYLKIGKNYLYVKYWDYIYLINWKVKIQEYVLTNFLFYVRSSMQYLWEKIEEYKTKDVLSHSVQI